MIVPEDVKSTLISFLTELPVKKFSKEWKAIQIAISILNSPQSFKKGVHVYITSSNKAHEEGYYDDKEMYIKIYPHKLMMRRCHSEYNSASGLDKNEVYRYIVPNEKYKVRDFYKIMEDLSGLFVGESYLDNTDYCGVCYSYENFHIEANVKI